MQEFIEVPLPQARELVKHLKTLFKYRQIAKNAGELPRGYTDNILDSINHAEHAFNKISAELSKKDEQPAKTLRQTALEIAISKLGVSEATGNNDGADIEEFQEYLAWLKNKPWCASFVSWSFKTASDRLGIKRPFLHEASVNRLANWARLNKLYFEPEEITPEPGDIFLILDNKDWNNSHTGLIRANGDSFISTIEGNVKNAVTSRWIPKEEISGYIRIPS